MALRYIPVCYWCISANGLDKLPWWELDEPQLCVFCETETTFVIETDRKVENGGQD